ncbi:S8 family peptidase [Pedobacter metabolipauper]|uniref:Subtilase family protein n=1 Tax=Pedobacter metabolipauper TaxID=425513 RepID=A0A4R6SY72_9SPHI|nr:S8 family peptidase [Pedobacter metabolipauper]TDQ10935.1 subtilase family protein [Pedobacter metabolipauper]
MKRILNILFVLAALTTATYAQQPGWLHKDLATDQIFGISAEKAYAGLLKGKKASSIIVAVLDAGADYKHEDLRNIIWKNKKETPDNGKDDDKNGYADDKYGWNFFEDNAVVDGKDCDHGTHVSGIIAAERNNGLGIDGIADHALIMPVRMVTTGDERDIDVARAIYYAVNNGARIINMSFGKTFSPQKSMVDSAVKYAVSKDVLFVHAAGNSHKDIDAEDNFPKAVYLDGGSAAASWIEVGASGFKDDRSLAAYFSNYGARTVDLFAPGVRIFSTIPGSKYESYNGTSMAAPVVTGIAALVRAYFPELTAVQVKEILVKSVIKVTHDVQLPGKAGTLVPFSQLCSSGGVVNAYSALVLAEEYSKERASK